MQAETLEQHRWLMQLVGHWTYEMDAPAEAGKPAQKIRGTENVRALGELWLLLEGQGEMPGGGQATMLMTLGYDPQQARFVGTWVGSMMTHLWVYENGALDVKRKVLSLEADGPSFDGEPGKLARYRDVIEIHDANSRTLSGHLLGADGQWSCFMTSRYQRSR
jgi:hypothetical protein